MLRAVVPYPVAGGCYNLGVREKQGYEPSRNRNSRRGPNSPLTTPQKRALSMLANKLWEESPPLREREWSGEVPKSRQAAEWRRRVVEEKFGIDSLTKAVDSQYADIKGEILEAAGLSAEALQEFKKTIRVKGNGATEDTPLMRGRMVWNIEHELSQWNQKHQPNKEHEMTTGYALSIGRSKFRQPRLQRLDELTVKELTQLLVTVKNRLAARGRKTKDEKLKK